MAIIDKIQLSGTVYTIGNETTTAVTSASTDNEIPTAKAVYDAIPQGGGGKAIEAGTNISITTGETADTINCTLPITATTDTTNKTISIGQEVTSDTNKLGCIVIGSAAKGKTYDVVVGNKAKNNGIWNDNVIIGYEAKGYSENIAIGSYTETYNDYQSGCVAIGYYARAKNIKNAVAIGHKVSTTGKTKTNINNQIKVDDSNQVYIYNKDNTEMIRLQDYLGGGGTSYTAGDGIDITNDVISVTGKVDTTTYETYTAATDTALASKQTTLTAGTGISIVDNVISATGGGGSITVDQSLDSDSTNPVANSAITETLGKYYYPRKFNNSIYQSPWGSKSSNGCVGFTLEFANILNPNDSVISGVWLSKINGKDLFYAEYSAPNSDYFNLNLVETSAITTSISSSSTDAQVPSAKAVYDMVGNINTILESI